MLFRGKETKVNRKSAALVGVACEANSCRDVSSLTSWMYMSRVRSYSRCAKGFCNECDASCLFKPTNSNAVLGTLWEERLDMRFSPCSFRVNLAQMLRNSQIRRGNYFCLKK